MDKRLPPFSALYDNLACSDLTIRFADCDVPGHKAVFAATCKVLKKRWFKEGETQDVLDSHVLLMTPGYSDTFVRIFVYGLLTKKEKEQKHLIDFLSTDQILELIELGEDYGHENATQTAREIVIWRKHTNIELEQILKKWPLNAQDMHVYGECIHELFSQLRKYYGIALGLHFKELEKLNLPVHVLKMWTKTDTDQTAYALAFVVYLWKGGSGLVALELLKEGNWTKKSFEYLSQIDFTPEKCRDSDTPFCQELWEIAVNLEINQEYNDKWQGAVMKQLAEGRKKRKIDE